MSLSFLTLSSNQWLATTTAVTIAATSDHRDSLVETLYLKVFLLKNTPEKNLRTRRESLQDTRIHRDD